jgi:hypothetical protein
LQVDKVVTHGSGPDRINAIKVRRRGAAAQQIHGKIEFRSGVLWCGKIVDANACFSRELLQIGVRNHPMVARDSSAIRIKICDGHGLGRLAAAGKKEG